MTQRRLDHRQLAFAKAIAEGKSGHDAQLDAAYRPNRKNMNRLLADDRVRAEIDRLRALIDAEWAAQQCELRLLNDPRVRAEIDKQAIELVLEWQARHRGLMTQRESTAESE